jgi:hypothetical protein
VALSGERHQPFDERRTDSLALAQDVEGHDLDHPVGFLVGRETHRFAVDLGDQPRQLPRVDERVAPGDEGRAPPFRQHACQPRPVAGGRVAHLHADILPPWRAAGMMAR